MTAEIKVRVAIAIMIIEWTVSRGILEITVTVRAIVIVITVSLVVPQPYAPNPQKE